MPILALPLIQTDHATWSALVLALSPVCMGQGESLMIAQGVLYKGSSSVLFLLILNPLIFAMECNALSTPLLHKRMIL